MTSISKNVGLQTFCACSVRKTRTGTHPRPPTIQRSFWIDFCVRITWSGKSFYYRDVILFEKLPFQRFVFPVHQNEKPIFSNSSGFEESFRKALFLRRISADDRPLAIEIKRSILPQNNK